MFDSANGDLLLTLTNSRHLIVTFNQFVEVYEVLGKLLMIKVVVIRLFIGLQQNLMLSLYCL